MGTLWASETVFGDTLVYVDMNGSRMNRIPIGYAKESNPLPICRMYREWLVSRYRLEPDLALKYLSDEGPLKADKSEEEMKALQHIRHCPKCKGWINSVIPKEVLERQRRMLRYCCAGMFCAVEENGKRGDDRIEFALFRGEDPCWMMNGKWSFISYCPWCGKKLPDKPFIP